MWIYAKKWEEKHIKQASNLYGMKRENKYEMLSIAIFIAKTINVCTYDQLPKENHLFPPFQ